MKLVARLLSILGSSILILLGGIMALINIRILFAGEFLLANNPAASFFFYFSVSLYLLSMYIPG
ncbi:MAG: hypothetical protein II467_06185 [Bacilli bacterium]|nr:hypothetical protein [Bacilli bacterium]